MTAHAFNPTIMRLRPADCYKFDASLSYILGSRPAWYTLRPSLKSKRKIRLWHLTHPQARICQEQRSNLQRHSISGSRGFIHWATSAEKNRKLSIYHTIRSEQCLLSFLRLKIRTPLPAPVSEEWWTNLTETSHSSLSTHNKLKITNCTSLKQILPPRGWNRIFLHWITKKHHCYNCKWKL